MSVEAPVVSIAGVRAGEATAVAAMFRKYQADILRYLLGWLRDRPVAEDLMSETFVRAIDGAARLRTDTVELLPWLRTIARNLLRDYAKSAYHRREVATFVLPEERLIEQDPCQKVVDTGDVRALQAAMQELSADQQRCLLLRFRYELSVQQTAALMERDIDAVKALQYRAIQKLKAIM